MGEKEKVFNLIKNKIFRLIELRFYLERIKNVDNKEEKTNDHNSTFFSVQDVYREELILGILALFDQNQSYSNENFSLRILEKNYRNNNHISNIFKIFFKYI
jgi:hypothetical protein